VRPFLVLYLCGNPTVCCEIDINPAACRAAIYLHARIRERIYIYRLNERWREKEWDSA